MLPTTVWTTKPNRFVYDFFSFHDVKYYPAFEDLAKIPPLELNRTELTYMKRIVGPPIYENYYENDLFDALAKSLNVDIYQELITKIQDTNAIAWLKYNESFRTTLGLALYIVSNKTATEDDYAFKGNLFAQGINIFGSAWGKKKHVYEEHLECLIG